jgi:hypothetical protein
MLVLLALFNILILIHLTFGSKKINSFIQIIIKNKYLENENNNSNSSDKQMKPKSNNIKNANKKNYLDNEVKKKLKSEKKRKKRISVIYNKKFSLGKINYIKRRNTSINLDIKNIPPKRKISKNKRINDDGSKTNERFLSNKKKIVAVIIYLLK